MKHRYLSGGILSMDKVREILRLKSRGFSQREIHRATGVARSCIQEYLRRAKISGIGYAEAKALSDSELKDQLNKKNPGRQPKAVQEPDWSAVKQELRERKGTTLELLWLEWHEKTGGGISYSTYCRRYRAWAQLVKVEYRHDYVPGEKFLSDFTGEKLPYLSDSGELVDAEIFVGVLGASDLIYVEALPSQRLLPWVNVHTRAFEFFGGVPVATVIDNLKSGVTKSDRYEPEINKTFLEWAEHFGTTVLPARAKKPQDKGKVEQAVQNVERWILAPLRKRRFKSLGELNAAIKERLKWLNNRVMKEYAASRQELFERLEKEHLQPLPKLPYVPAEWKRAIVNVDYHCVYEFHYYSVPYYLVRQEVWLRVTEHLIEIFHDNKRIAAHKRSNARYSYSTEAMHMPPAHRAMKSQTAPKFVRWSESVGPETTVLVKAILAKPQYYEQSFRSILGLQRLEKKHGGDALEEAARQANVLQLQSQRAVRGLLERSSQENQALLTHVNVRGPEYFH